MRSMAATEEKDVEKTISEDLVVTKYKLAGEIVNSKYYYYYYSMYLLLWMIVQKVKVWKNK